MEKITELEKRIDAIESRNKKVEADKAWETSLARKILIAGLTYIVVALYLGVVIKINPWINAIVPTMGFLLSTLSLSVLKEVWKQKFYY